MTMTALDQPTTKSNEPDIDNADAEQEAHNPFGVAQVSGFHIETMTFHIAEHFFNPHSFFIELDVGSVTSTVRDEIPRLIFSLFPVEDEPNPAVLVFPGQKCPTNDSRFALYKAQVSESNPLLTWPGNHIVARLTDDIVPTTTLKPVQEWDKLEAAVAHKPNIALCWQQRFDLAQQGNLLGCGNGSFSSWMNTPGQGQCSLPVSNGHNHQLMIEANFGTVNKQIDTSSSKQRDQLAGNRLVTTLHRQSFVTQKATQSINQTGQLAMHWPFAYHQRQLYSTAQVQSGHQQGQIAHSRNSFFWQPLAQFSQDRMIKSKVVRHRHLLDTTLSANKIVPSAANSLLFC
jgi:hypothetical protein